MFGIIKPDIHTDAKCFISNYYNLQVTIPETVFYSHLSK